MSSKKITLSALSKKFKWPLLIIGTIFVLGLIGYFIIIFGGKLVVKEEQLILDMTTTIETTDGKVIGELYNENRYVITIDQIPDYVQQAFVGIEDNRFYRHSGVDFKSVVRAVYRDILAFGKVEGASTITQQLAKNLFLYHDKTWMRKTKEVMAAIYLEREFSKDEILELYLNAIYFGHGVYGIEAASQKFFSKTAQELSIAEGALLAGIVKGPNAYSPINHPEKAMERRNVVLKVMEDHGFINTATRLQEQGKTIGLNIYEREMNPVVDSYIDLVLKEAAQIYQLTIDELRRGGYRLVVNLDDDIQRIAFNQFKNDEYFPGNTSGVEAAFVIMDKETGEIIAALGGRDYHLGNLNRVTVKRQPGSTIKPLAVYGPAFMTGKYEPFSMIKDEKIDYEGYTVANVDNKYEGFVSIYDAITTSKNTSAVWLLEQIGIDYAKEYLKKMHMNISDNGLAIALGGLSEGLSPLEVASGYRTFAHNGEYVQPYTINQIYNRENEIFIQALPEKTEVFSPQVAWDMTRILTKTVEEGTAQSGEYHKALAGKTGSTEHPHVKGMYKDAWFVGYTPEYVSAIWMGYDVSDQDHYLTGGSSYPTRLTKNILSEIDQYHELTEEFTKPEKVKDLADPINLPTVENVKVKYVFGGFSLIKGRISWDAASDPRVVYRVYREQSGSYELIGEVSGQDNLVIDKVSLLRPSYYYVVPYDPLTKIEGDPSDVVELSLKQN